MAGRWFVNKWQQPERLCEKDFFSAGDALAEHVDFFFGVVEGQRGAHGAVDAVMVHHRLGAMGAGSDGDAEFVEHHAHVVGMDAVDQE